MSAAFLLAFVLFTVIAFVSGRNAGRAFRVGLPRGGAATVHSLPNYHGWSVAYATAIPMLIVFLVWSAIAPGIIEKRALSELPQSMQATDQLARATALREISNAMSGGALSDAAKPEVRAAAQTMSSLNVLSNWGRLAAGIGVGLIGFLFGKGLLKREFRARNRVERAVTWVLIASSAVAVLTTIGIVFSVAFETFRFFEKYPWNDFLFGLQWSPQIAMRADQVGQSGAFGFVPLFVGTLLIMLIAMTVAVPIGLFAAIYMAEYASPRTRNIVKPVLEVLAGVPTVVFGFFAALTVAPFIRVYGAHFGLDIASESALAAGFVMGVMIIPFVSSLSDDVINAVPQSLRDGSYALGATKSETVKKVVLPAALAGIVAAVMLAVSRAIGETMIVVMAAGLAGNLTFNPLDAVTTITVQIKTLLVGDQEFDSVKTLSAFALGFVLFFFTLLLIMLALKVVKRYQEQYD